jgi:hypothetical protein
MLQSVRTSKSTRTSLSYLPFPSVVNSVGLYKAYSSIARNTQTYTGIVRIRLLQVVTLWSCVSDRSFGVQWWFYPGAPFQQKHNSPVITHRDISVRGVSLIGTSKERTTHGSLIQYNELLETRPIPTLSHNALALLLFDSHSSCYNCGSLKIRASSDSPRHVNQSQLTMLFKPVRFIDPGYRCYERVPITSALQHPAERSSERLDPLRVSSRSSPWTQTRR